MAELPAWPGGTLLIREDFEHGSWRPPPWPEELLKKKQRRLAATRSRPITRSLAQVRQQSAQKVPPPRLILEDFENPDWRL